MTRKQFEEFWREKHPEMYHGTWGVVSGATAMELAWEVLWEAERLRKKEEGAKKRDTETI